MCWNRKIQLTSAGLHLLAMGLMLCDHLWATFFLQAGWLTCLGRLAFPIFAFLLAEGFRQTKNRKNYLLRLFFWALVSEIPFNLMYSGQVFYPVHQNVLWIFCLSLLLLWGMDWLRQRFPSPLAWPLCAALAAAGFFLGYLIMADYYGPGVLTVLVFSLFPKRDWKSFCGQFVCLALIHGLMLGSFLYTVPLFGWQLELPQQGLAVLALIPIWLYRGKQGCHSKRFRFLCYAFYPGHMALLVLIRQLIAG